MDPVTHTFTGAALARAGLDRKTALAAPTLVLAANAPDVDILVYLDGPFAALAFRRGITHGLLAMAVLPFAVAGVMLGWDRWVRRRRRPDAAPARPGALLVLAVLGLLTHPVLDWMNTYGLRWLVPFSDAWTYGDALFIVDPWIWLVLGAGLHRATPRGWRWEWAWWVFWALASAVVLAAPVPLTAKVVWGGAMVGVLALTLRGRAPEPGRPVRLAGGLALAYTLLMVAGDLGATGRVRAAASAGGVGPIEAVMVAPRPADPLGGDVVLRSGDHYLVGSHRWLDRPPVRLERSTPVPLRSGPGLPPGTVERAVAAASDDPRARDFLRWARFPRWRIEARPDGYTVRISDLRYEGAGSLGGLVVELDEEFAVEAKSEAGGAAR